MENQKLPHDNPTSRKVVYRVTIIPGVISLVLAVYFAVNAEWPWVAIMALGVLSSIVRYYWYKRRFSARDAAAKADSTVNV